MPSDLISYQDSGYFSSIINDYLNRKAELSKFYNRFPSTENFQLQIEEKRINFRGERDSLVSVLQSQYQQLSTSKATRDNIELLRQAKTFTITTGHQLNIFSGPVYFIYKIVSTIKLAGELSVLYPENNFIPVFWMATEDHDFEEISHFKVADKKYTWNKEASGPVGRFDTDGLSDILTELKKDFGSSEDDQYLLRLFEKSYIGHGNLADATRYLANEIFKDHGLVIIDGDHPQLKKQFSSVVKDELLNRSSFKQVDQTISVLNYDAQVNSREINLFYIENGLRERIVPEGNGFHVLNTDLHFTTESLFELLEKHPERFSPNVILRPLYQEIILPNLAYIGGGGEIAYWLQLKSMFAFHQISFPMLIVRNSALIASQKQSAKADKLNLSWKDLFSSRQELNDNYVRRISDVRIDLSPQKFFLQEQFKNLHELAEKTDRSFSGAVKAQEAKQLKGLDKLEKRLLKAQKRKHKELLARVTELQESLFPAQGLQERQMNFSHFYRIHGGGFINSLFAEFEPLEQNFNIIVL